MGGCWWSGMWALLSWSSRSYLNYWFGQLLQLHLNDKLLKVSLRTTAFLFNDQLAFRFAIALNLALELVKAINDIILRCSELPFKLLDHRIQTFLATYLLMKFWVALVSNWVSGDLTCRSAQEPCSEVFARWSFRALFNNSDLSLNCSSSSLALPRRRLQVIHSLIVKWTSPLQLAVLRRPTSFLVGD